MDDWQLLNDYAVRGSEEAFRTLVDRHAGMVYHTALRQTGNPHTAEEATQAVFIALARKADKISRSTILYGWLFRATRFAVLNLVREAACRQRHEQEAHAMQLDAKAGDADSIWEQITPRLNDALERLSPSDRDILMIRYFGNKSHREIALELGISEDSAKKRASRAIEKLRDVLARRGVAVSTVGLMAALAVHGAQAAPLGLASTVAAAAIAKGTVGTASSLTTAKGILKLMAWAKVKAAAVVVGSVLLAAGTTAVVVEQVQNAGAIDGPISGRVVLPDGKPAAGLKVYLCVSNQWLDLDPDGQFRFQRGWDKNGELYDLTDGHNRPIAAQTDADGQFSFPRTPKPFCVVMSDGQDFAQVGVSNLVKGTPIVLQPLTTVTGTLFVGAKPAVDKKVRMKPFEWSSVVSPYAFGRVYFDSMAMKTDLNGHFRFKAPAGEYTLGQDFGGYQMSGSAAVVFNTLTQTTPVRVKAGESVSVQLGGVGRTVIGRVLAPDGSPGRQSAERVFLRKILPQYPPKTEKMTDQDYNTQVIAPWFRSPEGRASYWDQREYLVQFGDEGAFKIQDVPPGEYQLHIPLTKWYEVKMQAGGSGGSQLIWLADAAKKVVVEKTPPGQDPDAQPLDLGTLQMKETPENLQYFIDHGFLVTNQPRAQLPPRGGIGVAPDPQMVAALNAQIKARQSAKTTSHETTIDLFPYTNAKLNEPLGGDADIKDNTLGELPSGTHIFGGVPFNIRGIIQLGSGESASFARPVPDEVKDIKIGHKFKNLHVLHAALNGAGPRYNDTVAKFVLHYADGSQAELPLGTFGLETLFKPAWLAEMPQNSELAWIGINPYLKEYKPRFALHLYRTTLQNPKPDLEVTTIDYVSTLTSAAPLMAGLTIE